MPLAQGQVLRDRYRIVNLLGQGVFGAVYRAWDTTFEIPCAIKENTEISDAAQRQFLREARMLRTLRHPNLPMVTDYFVILGQGQYLVMDYVEGQDLGEMLQSGPLPEARVLPWIIQVCDALSYLHSQNPPIIHRDIKPGNIKITPGGKAMLVDFGISKVYDPDMATTEGARAVTPGYSPPEQYGQGTTDVRSDLYALGATLYHLLTGQAPPDSVDILTHSKPPPPPAVELNPAISQEIAAAVARAMELERERRWGSAEEFKGAITTRPSAASKRQDTSPVATQVIPETPSSRTVTVQADAHERKTPWGWIGLIAGLVVVVFLIYVLSGIFAPLPAQITDDRGVQMALIPAGPFLMGSEDGGDGERPVHEVYLDDFYIDIYEVTNALYKKCVDAGVCDPLEKSSSSIRDRYYGNPEYADYPVIYVDWDMARTYCEWRDARLPTEAEWEKAARGGLEGAKYPWGDDAPVCQEGELNGARFNDDVICNGMDTTETGSYRPNGYGLYDMAGNVWEWAADWHGSDYYAISPSENPLGPESGEFRVLRGGSWKDSENLLWAAHRWYNPELKYGSVGFRCTCSP